MTSILQRLDALSLRQRFLVAPLFCLALLVVVTAAFMYESQRQNALLTRIAERELMAFELYSDVFTELSAQHIAIYELLSDASKTNEETLYDNAKYRLYAIHDAIRRAEEALPPAANGSDRQSLREKAIALTHVYRRAVTSAVEMTTVNMALAPSHIAIANERFIDMNRAFTELLNVERQALSSEIKRGVDYSSTTQVVFTVAGIFGAILVLVLSHVLSRLLSRSLDGWAQPAWPTHGSGWVSTSRE